MYRTLVSNLPPVVLQQLRMLISEDVALVLLAAWQILGHGGDKPLPLQFAPIPTTRCNVGTIAYAV